MSNFEKLSFVLIGENLKRVNIEEDENGLREITIDLHGLTCQEVRRILNGTIALFRNNFRLTLIHGYRHGMALKTMLLYGYENSRIKSFETESYNHGITHLVIK